LAFIIFNCLLKIKMKITKLAASFLLLNVALIGSLVYAQEESFSFETGSGRRSGTANLKLIPDSEAQRT
jgi:hypothetical protein